LGGSGCQPDPLGNLPSERPRPANGQSFAFRRQAVPLIPVGSLPIGAGWLSVLPKRDGNPGAGFCEPQQRGNAGRE